MNIHMKKLLRLKDRVGREERLTDAQESDLAFRLHVWMMDNLPTEADLLAGEWIPSARER